MSVSSIPKNFLNVCEGEIWCLCTVTTAGNRFKSGDKKTIRREGAEPLKKFYLYSLLSNTEFVNNFLIKQLIYHCTIA